MAIDIESIETVIPGVITAVNDGKVNVRPVIRKVATNGVIDVVNPELKNVPLMKIGGANAEFSFPSKEGDQVLLVAFSRDASKWKKSDEDDLIPTSCSGMTLNDIVAVPFVKSAKEGSAKIKVSQNGDIVLQPASGRKIVAETDLVCKGTVYATTEVAARCTYEDETSTVVDVGAVHLTMHTHASAVGPTSPPQG